MAPDISDSNPVFPAAHAASVTPSDSTDLATPTRFIYIGGAGNLNVDLVGGETVTLNGVAVGVLHAIRVRRVRLTGTTATNIVALW